MGKMETKELTTAEIYNIVSFYAGEISNQQNGGDTILSHFSNLLNWKLKRNIDILRPIAISFEEFRNKVRDNFIAKWNTDEFSEDVTITRRHDDGSEVIDADGNPVTELVRRIKSEYYDRFTEEQARLNNDIAAVLREKVTVEINLCDIESEIENVINSVDNVDVGKIDCLMFMHD